MEDQDKTKEQLVGELAELRQRAEARTNALQLRCRAGRSPIGKHEGVDMAWVFGARGLCSPVRPFCRRKIGPVMLLILCLVGSGIRPASANEEVTLHLQWYHQFQFAGYYAAQEKGYFREEGLYVTIVEGGPGIENFKAVISAPGHYGTGHAAGLLLHRANGEPLVALASIFQHSPNVIIARADGGIRNPHDLVAERTIIWPGGHVELSAMFQSEGIDPSPFLHEAKGSHLQDLIDGRIDAIDGYVTNEAIAAREAGVPVVVISPINYGVDFYGDVLMTSERELREHPDRTKAFRAASLRGWEYALEHPQEIVELLLSKYAAKPGRGHLLSEAEATKQLVLDPLIEIGHTNPGRWQKMADTLGELHLAEPGIRAEDFLFDPNPEIDLTELYTGFGIAVAAAAGISLFAFLLLHYNRRLRRKISERKQAEDALRKSEELYRKAIRTAGGCAYYRDLVTRTYSFVDEGIEDLTGYPQKDFTPASWQSITLKQVPVGDLSGLTMDEINRMARKPDGTWQFEHLIRTPSGEERWVVNSGVYVGDESGKVVGNLGLLIDITARKKAEEALRESERKFRALTENTPGIVFMIGRDGEILYMNHPPEGVDLDDVIGTSMFSHMDPDYRESVGEHVRIVFDRRETRQYETRGIGPLGRQSDYLSIVGPVLGDQGEVASAIVSTQDITERKVLEEALRESEEQLSSLVANIPGASYRCLIDEDWTMLFISSEVEAISGFPASDFIKNLKRSYASIIHPEDAEAAAKIALDAVSRKEHYSLEYRIVRADGELRWVFEKGQGIYNDRGEAVYLDGVFVDITDRKQAEVTLIEAERSRVLAETATAAAHEINQPLTVILGMADLLSRKLSPYGGGQADLKDITMAGERIEEIVRKMVAARRYLSTSYVGGTRMVDFDRAARKGAEGGAEMAEK